ncbi:hypothetical protein DB313_04925 (plasmid) [Borrelia turcica IST7]|uniref:Uncharacterized protein n=1 Tax=Borrelia turcica IST7 TaxID=1104446 RepID=A0A386PMQ2_9SPIR|nr:hypothetical protein [Borrelia turcica]AYE36844.1 hypothetical protein DB313_04925 [Borrelia turcica IST7]
MRLYGVLLVLLVILMGCSQQTSKEKTGEKTGTTKTGNKRKQKGVNQKKLDEKPVDDEINDNDDGEEGDIKDNTTGEEGNSGDGGGKARYAVLEKKVKELREKHERAKNKFKEAGHPFPNEEERSRLFPDSQPNIHGYSRATRAFLAKQYSFFNIVKLMRQQDSDRYPDFMDDIYAGLEYDASLLAEVDKIITKLNHEGQSSEPKWFYLLFLNRICEVGEYNRKVLYEYLSDATLAKLKSGNEADIEKANKLLGEFMKKKADLLGLIKTQIKAVENKEKRSDFFMNLIRPRLEAMRDVYDDLEESSENIKNFVRS